MLMRPAERPAPIRMALESVVCSGTPAKHSSTRQTSPTRSLFAPGQGVVVSGAGRACGGAVRWLKVWVVSLLMAVSAFLSAPQHAGAFLSAGSSHVNHETKYVDEKHARKKLVLAGGGVEETMNQVFKALDTQKTGKISKASLYASLCELKRRGFLTHSLSERELDVFLSNLAEQETAGVKSAAATGDQSASDEAARLTAKSTLIRFDTFKKAVDFAEKKSKVFEKRTRQEIMEIETHTYGHKWNPKQVSELRELKAKVVGLLQGSFVGLIYIALPSYYAIPWDLFRFDYGKYRGRSAKKQMMKQARIVGKRSEYFR